MKEKIPHKIGKIRHIMADGTVLDDIKDYKLDIDKIPFVVKRIIAEMLMSDPTQNQQKPL
ncbi:MAG: hypothetical protein RSB36_08040 [Hydrogenoanaerobacterium sp.]